MKLRVRLPNGEEIESRTEEWLAAVLVAMPKEQRDRVLAIIEKPGRAHILLSAILATLPDDQKARVAGLVAGKIVGYSTPGSHVLHAEPAAFNQLSKGGG